MAQILTEGDGSMPSFAGSLTPDEIGERGEQIYRDDLRSRIESGNIGRFVAIDVNTGNYEVGDEHLDAVMRLHGRVPNAVVYTIKIGYPATAVIGGRLRPNEPEAGT